MTVNLSPDKHSTANRTAWQRVGRYIKLTFGLLLLAAFVLYIVRNHEKFGVVVAVRWEIAAGLVLITVLARSIGAMRYRTTCRALGAKLRFGEALLLILFSDLTNLVLPFHSSVGARAAYLRTVRQLPLSKMPALSLCNNVLMLTAGGFLLLLANTLLLVTGYPVPWQLWALAAVAACSVSVFAFSPTVLQRIAPARGRVARIIAIVVEGWETLRADRKTLGAVFLWGALFIVASMGNALLGFHALGITIGLPTALCISIFSAVSGLLNLTPGNLGVREVIVGTIARVSGVSFHHGIAAALIVRVVQLPVIVLGGLVGYYVLFIRRRDAGEEDPGEESAPASCPLPERREDSCRT